MTFSRGAVEIIRLAQSPIPKSFTDFTKITINKKRLSTATVLKRLNELVKANILEEKVIRSKTGRRVIGYKTTDLGNKVLDILNKLNL
ncbi:MAG: hypothetical protein ACP5M9_03155 [Candidatus Micrarchaeia archaeon]